MHLGIDLGGTTCSLGLLDENGLGATSEIETRQNDVPDVLLGRIAQAARELLAQNGASAQTVGIGVPGPVKHREGICVIATNLNGWQMLPVGPMLSEKMGAPVHVLNDANAAAFGEARFGAGRGSDDVLVVTLGTGIGSGLILDGQLRLGPYERGAEIGHITVDINDKRGTAGNVGTLESVCGRDAIVWRALRAMTWGRDSILHEICPDLSELTPRHIALAAEQGDDLANRVWLETASYLAVGIVNAIFTADVSRVVLAGGVAAAGDVLLLPLRRAVRARTSKLHFDPEQIVMSTLGNRAGLIGAAQWAREQSG